MINKSKWALLFLGIQFTWCVWLVVATWQQVEKSPVWWNVAALTMSILLLTYWFWSIYRVVKPKKLVDIKELDYIIKEEPDGTWWASRNDNSNGPFTSRADAFDWLILDVKNEMKTKNTFAYNKKDKH